MSVKNTKDPRQKCLDDLTHYIQWARMDDGIFLNIEPLQKTMVHNAKNGKKMLLLATLSGEDECKKKILNHLSDNVKYDGQNAEFHGCYLPGDIFVYVDLPTVTKESSTIANIANEFDKAITDKSMEYDAKAFIKIAKINMETWEKSLERGKHGVSCNFKAVSKKISEIRQDIIEDDDGVLGNKHVLFIDTTRYLNLIKTDLYKLIDTTQQWIVKHFSSGLAREESITKLKKNIDDYKDDIDSARADKKDYRWSFLLDEFDDMIDDIKSLISPSSSHKGTNIFRILDDYSSILETLGLQVDLEDDMEQKKMLMKQYTYSKELISIIISVVKTTTGTLYGSIVSKVMNE